MKLTFYKIFFLSLVFIATTNSALAQEPVIASPSTNEVPVYNRLSVATNIPNNFLRESVMFRYQNFGTSLTASRSFGIEMNGYQFDAGLVSHDTIHTQGQSPVEARLMPGYQWGSATTKSKKVSTSVLNHKISISNPLGAMAKVRLRYEIRGKKNGLLVAGLVNYFGIDNSQVDSTQQKSKVGWQIFAEGRRYLPSNGLFLYGKVGKGQSAIYEYTLNHHGYYNYQYFGAGVGMSQNFSRKFFYEINLGAKICLGATDFIINYQSSASNLVGVMSAVDMNIHFGMYLNQRPQKMVTNNEKQNEKQNENENENENGNEDYVNPPNTNPTLTGKAKLKRIILGI